VKLVEADSKGAAGGRPLLVQIFLSKSCLFLYRRHIVLCTFAISDDGADTLSSAPPFKIFARNSWGGS